MAERSELTNERQMVFMVCERERGGFFCGESVGVVARGGAGRLSSPGECSGVLVGAEEEKEGKSEGIRGRRERRGIRR